MKQIWKIEYIVDFDAKNPKITTVFSLGNLMITLTPLQLFKNLSDETRLNIILLLRESGELCVCELCDTLNESQPKISRHLAMLRESGLLLDRRVGKWIHYRLSPHIPAWAATVIEQAYLSQRDKIVLLVSTNVAPGGKAICL